MKVLLLDNDFPGKFAQLAKALVAKGHKVVFASLASDPVKKIPGVKHVVFSPQGRVNPETHHYLYSVETAVHQGQAAYFVVNSLVKQGFKPDVVYGYSGFGATMYMKDLFPQVPLVCYFEVFYHAHGTNFDFDNNIPLEIDEELRIRTSNAVFLQDLYSCDYGISPTQWQFSLLPSEYHNKIRIFPDGIDTDVCCPQDNGRLILSAPKLDLTTVSELVTYTARGLEPLRGFPQFLAALAILQKKRPDCHAVIVGRDRTEYDANPTDGKTYKQYLLENVELDLSRVHFIDWLPYDDYVKVLQASSVHVYLTKPFVLSWSMLEAMACGCAIVASNTQPVQEVIADGVNGLLVDFFSPAQIASRMEKVLTHPTGMADMRAKARQRITEKYSLTQIMPRQIEFLEQVAATAKKRH